MPRRTVVSRQPKRGSHGPDAGGCQAVLFEVRALTPSQHHGYPRLRGAPHTPAMSTMSLPPTFSPAPIRCLARNSAVPATAKAPATSWWSPSTGRSTRLRRAPACAGSSVRARTRRRPAAAHRPAQGTDTGQANPGGRGVWVCGSCGDEGGADVSDVWLRGVDAGVAVLPHPRRIRAIDPTPRRPDSDRRLSPRKMARPAARPERRVETGESSHSAPHRSGRSPTAAA